APIGTGRRLAGGDAADDTEVRSDLVGARQETHDLDRLQGAGPGIDRIGTDVADHIRLQRGRNTIGIESHFGVDDLGEGLAAAADILQTIRRPFERAAKLARGDADQQFLGIERTLRAEASADIGRDHAQAVAGKAERLGNRVADDTGNVRRRVKRDGVAALFVFRRIAPRLHRKRRLADHFKTSTYPDRSGLQIAGDVALPELARDQDVRARLFVQQRSVGSDGEFGANYRMKRLVVDLDQVERILREISRGGDDGDNGLADVANLAGGERQDRRRVIIGHPREWNHRLEVVGDAL